MTGGRLRIRVDVGQLLETMGCRGSWMQCIGGGGGGGGEGGLGDARARRLGPRPHRGGQGL